MIVGFLIKLFAAFVSFLIGLLPVVAFPSGIATAITTVMGYVNALSWLFPVSTLITVLGIMITYEIGIFTFKFTRWLIHLIRGN